MFQEICQTKGLEIILSLKHYSCIESRFPSFMIFLELP